MIGLYIEIINHGSIIQPRAEGMGRWPDPKGNLRIGFQNGWKTPPEEAKEPTNIQLN